MTEIAAIFRQFFDSNSKFVLAFSSGPDSTFLAELLGREKFEKIFLAHFDHRWRGAENSRIEKEFTAKIAKKFGWKFFIESWENPEKSETAARGARWKFLNKIADETGAAAILTGHHFDDQTETIFLNFLRGAGLRGLRGMKIWEKSRRVFRPLLQIRKSEILQFLTEKKLPFCVDETNFETTAPRNFLRGEIFPQLEKKFPEFAAAVSRTGKIAKNWDEFFDPLLKSEIQNLKSGDGFSRAHFLGKSNFVRAEIWRQLFAPRNLDFRQIENLDNFLRTARSGKKLALCGRELQTFGENFWVRGI